MEVLTIRLRSQGEQENQNTQEGQQEDAQDEERRAETLWPYDAKGVERP